MDPNRLLARAVAGLTGQPRPEEPRSGPVDRPLTEEEGRALAQALEGELVADVRAGGGRLEIGRLRERCRPETTLPLRAQVIHGLSDRRDR